MERSEMSRLIAEKVMGWKWVQAPKYDIDGKLPEQGMVLVPPDLDEETHQWPLKGLIPPYAYVDGSRDTKYFTDPAAMVDVMEKTGMVVGPGDRLWGCNPPNKWGAYVPRWSLKRCVYGTTPMEAVALAAFEMVKEKNDGI